MGKMGIEKLSRGFDRQGQTRPKLIRGRDGRGTPVPGTYKVGGRRVAKPTSLARDSSLQDR
jgi:hypothetical protein